MNKKVLVILTLTLCLLLALGGFALLRFSPYGVLNPASAEVTVENYLRDHDETFFREQFIAMAAPDVTEFESAGDVAAAVFDGTSGEWSFREWEGRSSARKPVYILSRGRWDIFSAALTYSGDGWQVEALDCPGFLTGDTRTLTVTVPSEASVTCNGRPVPESYITDSAVPYDDMSALESSIAGHPCRVTYEIPGIYLAATVEASADGGAVLLHADGTSWRYTRSAPGAKTLRITAPENAVVSVGGVPLDPASAAERSVYATVMDVPEEYLASMPAYLVYSIGGLYGEYDVAAELNGEALESSLMDGTIAFTLPGNEALRSENHERAEEFLRRMCQYGAGGYSPSDMCVPGSQANEFFYLATNSVIWIGATGVSFAQVDAYDFIPVGEDAFICRGRVQCTTTTSFGAWDHDMYYEMLWLRSGGVWLVSDLAYL